MKKVCKQCKIFVDAASCPICKGNQFTENWKGRMFINNVDKSEIAEKIGIKVKGEYGIKVK